MSLLAQSGNLKNPFGPTGFAVTNYAGSVEGSGLVLILNNLISLLVIIAGLYTFLNFILAGYQFISAGGDPKNITKASAKIWQSLVGLLLVAGSFALAAIVGMIIFGDATILLSPRIFKP